MNILGDFFVCLQLFSRLPVPGGYPRTEDRGFADAAAMAPLAGAVVGLVPGAVLIVLASIGLPPLPAAVAAMAAVVLTTGALHEDGLADCADGFGGGRIRERKLEIMRDSRIGTFGACALVLGLLFRSSCVAAMAAPSPWLAATELVAVAAVSRFACLMPLALLAPARGDGLGARAGRPRPVAMGAALAIATAAALLPVAAGLGLGHAISALALALIGGLAVCGLAARQIGGHTGDVAGAAQQVAEAAALLVYALAAGGHG